MRILSSSVIAAMALAQLGATDCGKNVLRDPGFDLWCGDALCSWKLERGDVARAPTWHADDAGVELLAEDTAIEQFSSVDSRDGTCIRFDLVADVAETAQVELGIDVYGDGSIERTFTVPTAHWQPVSFLFRVAAPYTGIRFDISKHGPGRAVVARLHAAVAYDPGCEGVTPLVGGPAPIGALCDVARDCASLTCVAPLLTLYGDGHAVCAACDLAHPACGASQVCGLDDPGRPDRSVPIACVPAAARVLGEQCLVDGECASGKCTDFVCSSCRTGADCAGAACVADYPSGPHVCDAGNHHAARGAPCATDADCASGACRGPARRQCLDGRACATDVNCPVGGNLAPGPCTTVGIQGGSCD